uniref:Uncharacterized protein n=1 Tax=Chenopodium quinoa TaxID=63459 RepID=A0A803M9J0_CHEQI
MGRHDARVNSKHVCGEESSYSRVVKKRKRAADDYYGLQSDSEDGNDSQNFAHSSSHKSSSHKSRDDRRRKHHKSEMIDPSKGELVKARYDVVNIQARRCRKGPNVICRVDMFYLRVIKSLDKSRKEEVKLMGFGGLLELKLNYLPRQLCYWIMSRIQSCGSIEFGDEQVMMLAPIQLQCILGLPMEEKVVPLKVDRDDRVMVKKLDGIIRDYRAGGKNGDQLSLVKAIGVVTKGLDKDGNELPLANDAEKMQFRNAFLIVVLGALLCPTTKWGLLAKKLTPAITVARHSAKYDWCTMVYNWLIDCVKVFADKFDENGFAAGCGGCSLFVLVFYLDHLHRPPVRWGVLPRIKVWTAVEVTRATKEDKRRTSDDYGKLMVYAYEFCAPVAYGEEDHPYAVRDSSRTLVQKVAAEVVNLLKPQLQSMVSEAVRNEVQSPIKTIIPLRRRTILISDLTRMKSSDLIRREGEERSAKSSDNDKDEERSGKNSPEDMDDESKEKTPKDRDDEPKEKTPKDRDDEHKENSPKQRGPKGPKQKAPTDGVPGDEQTPGRDDVLSEGSIVRPHGSNRRTREKRPLVPTNISLVSGLKNTTKQSILEKRFIEYVRSFRSVRSGRPGLALVQCNGVDATLKDCYHLLMVKECISSIYVRMASRLYTKRWEVEQFIGKSRRVLMSPDFSICAVYALSLFLLVTY